MNQLNYQVACLRFALCSAEELCIVDRLPSLLPFRIANEETEPTSALLFTLLLRNTAFEDTSGDIIMTFDSEDATCEVKRTAKSEYCFRFMPFSSREEYLLLTNDDYSRCETYLPDNTSEAAFVFNNILMMLFAFTAAQHRTLLLHASVTALDGRGYLFLGRSGTGKSTHSRLWNRCIEGSELLNDDNPALQLTADSGVVYGTPWSGKTPCYRNVSAKVAGIVRLEQAPVNKIEHVRRVIQGFALLLPSCSIALWDEKVAGNVRRLVEAAARVVPTYRLSCLPNEEAAKLCFETINGKE